MIETRRQSATVVLNHGGFFGAWCWRFVEDRLHGRGIPTVAINRWTNIDILGWLQQTGTLPAP